MRNIEQHPEQETSLLIGINAVHEALRGGRPIDSVLVGSASPSGAAAVLLAQCRQKGVVIKQVDMRKLDQLCGGGVHQGIAAYVAAHSYAQLSDLLDAAKARGEAPFVILCDSLEDPHNLGAILRTADAVGAHGVVIPKRRSVSLNFTVAKTSAGAVEYVPVARVTNLCAAIAELKKAGLWIYAADAQGTDFRKQDFSGPLALVVGSEGNGIGRAVLDACDFTVSLPMKGQLNSLNASVAAGILLFEIAKYR